MDCEHDPMIPFATRIPASMRDELREAASARARRSPGFNTSDLVREALREKLDKQAQAEQVGG